MPLQNGLYAAAAGAIIYALFGTSRQISTGPSSSLAAVAGGAVVAVGIAGDQAAELVAAIAIVTGLLFLALALLRLGWISHFLSKAVVTGFLAGAAVDVVVGELSKLTGTDAEGDNAWREFGSWLGSLGDVHWATVAVGALALALILGLRFLAPAVPGALVLVAVGILAADVLDLGDHGVALVGDVPSGLPTPELPALDLVKDHVATIAGGLVGAVLIGFSQTAGDARAFAARHRYRIDVDQESVAQGMANVGAGVLQGMPVSTSLSASSLNESAGASTPVASLITGALVLLTLLFLAPLFSNLPKAVLAAVIIDAVVFGMIDVAELRRLRRVARFDFWIAAAAIVGVLSSGVLAGVIIGVALSLIWLIRVAATPPIPLLGRERGTQVFRDLDEHPGDETFPGSSCCGSTAGCSSPPRRRSRTAFASSPKTAPRRSRRSSSTSRASTSSTRRAPSSSLRSTSSWRATTRRCASRASSRRCSPCSARTASPTGSAPTTSTATCIAPSRQQLRS